MSRDVSFVIKEMIETIDYLDHALDEHDFKSFTQNITLRFAAQRAIEIISEASRHLPVDLVVSEPDIQWNKIRGMGNYLRHEYHNIQDEIVWDVAINRLDDLRAALARMLTHL